MCVFFFFFQAEDGIRDSSVTGVQTCALPIFGPCISQVVDRTIARLAEQLGLCLPYAGYKTQFLDLLVVGFVESPSCRGVFIAPSRKDGVAIVTPLRTCR